MEAHILRSEGRDNFKFCFWQFLVNLNKCAKFYLNLSRCLPGAGQACADLPLSALHKIGNGKLGKKQQNVIEPELLPALCLV